MFGIGLTEMILIGIVILMLFSPRELPGMLKSVAKVYGSIRRTAEDFRSQVMDAEELREPIEEIRAAYHGTKQELMSAQDLARRELQRARSETMRAQQKLSELVREESRRKDPLPEPPKPGHPRSPRADARRTRSGRRIRDRRDRDRSSRITRIIRTTHRPHDRFPRLPGLARLAGRPRVRAGAAVAAPALDSPTDPRRRRLDAAVRPVARRRRRR